MNLGDVWVWLKAYWWVLPWTSFFVTLAGILVWAWWQAKADSKSAAKAATTFLDPSPGPVIRGLERFEVVYAEHQPQYIPLRVLKASDPSGRVLSRWSPTDEQRRAISNGADIFLTQLTFRNPLQPVLLGVSGDPKPEEFGLILEQSQAPGPPDPPRPLKRKEVG